MTVIGILIIIHTIQPRIQPIDIAIITTKADIHKAELIILGARTFHSRNCKNQYNIITPKIALKDNVTASAKAGIKAITGQTTGMNSINQAIIANENLYPMLTQKISKIHNPT